MKPSSDSILAHSLSSKLLRRCCAPGLLALAASLAFAAPSAQAAPAKIFVASYGSDSNAGTSVAPKRNFQTAHDAVAAGGEIVVLDTAGYGKLSITKSVSVVVPPGVSGFITASSGDGIDINTSIGDVVTLRGLTVEGPAGAGTGIYASVVGTLSVEDCTVRGFNYGIYVSSPFAADVSLRHTTVRDGTTGIALAATSANIVEAVLTDCVMDNVTNNALYATSSPVGKAEVIAVNCVLAHGGSGATSVNSNSKIVVERCVFSGLGKALVSSANGKLYSAGNNSLTNSADLGDSPTIGSGF